MAKFETEDGQIVTFIDDKIIISREIDGELDSIILSELDNVKIIMSEEVDGEIDSIIIKV